MPDAQRHAIPVWAHGLSVGNPTLDAEHILLLELGRTLLELLHEDPVNPEQVLAYLEDIARTAAAHEAAEERILEANRCPTLEAHREDHRRSRATLAGLLRDAANGALHPETTTRLISEWMGHHVVETDLPVRQYLTRPASAG